MNRTTSILKNGIMALVLSLILLGCAQTQTFVKESGASYKQEGGPGLKVG